MVSTGWIWFLAIISLSLLATGCFYCMKRRHRIPPPPQYCADHRLQGSEKGPDDSIVLHELISGFIESKDVFEPEVCSVCLDIMKKEDRVCHLACNHRFHEDCIFRWVLKPPMNCPLCKRYVFADYTPEIGPINRPIPSAVRQ